MTRQPFERLLRTFVSDVPETAPRELLESILIDLPSVPQRRDRFGLGRRFPQMFAPLRVAAIAAAALVVAVAAYTMLPRTSGPGGTTPTLAATPTAAPTPTQTPAPTQAAEATPRIAGATVATPDGALVAGTVYVLPTFEPAFSFEGGASVVFAVDGQRYAWFVHPTSAKINAGVVQPGMVFADGGSAEALPADIVAWLQARDDLTITSVTPVTLGSVEGSLLEGSVAQDAFQNSGGAINVFCPGPASCDFQSGGSLGYARGDHVLILVATVGGLPVTAIASAPETDWATEGAALEAMLRSFAFPG
jgi:hypothetical protein